MSHKIKQALVSILAAVFCFEAWALTAYLVPEEINQGDTTKLMIEAKSKTPSLQNLDTSALQQDFELLGTSSSVQTVVSQSSLTYSARWEIELFPLRAGQLTVPPIKFNGSQTQPLTLKVNQPSQSGQGNVDDVFVEMLVDPMKPYIGQQVNVTVRLYHKIRIVNGTLSEPEVANADVFRLGKDINFVKVFGGQQYNVLERKFAMFANTSGDLAIPPVQFKGQIEAKPDKSTSGFNTFIRQVRNIKRASNPVEISFKDIPDSFSGQYWLPASDLKISQQWLEPKDDLKVGDSVNRLIKLIADGLPAESLPHDIMADNLDGVHVYPDRVKRHNQDVGSKLLGKVEQQYALVLSSKGIVDLPQIQIKWWDIDEDVEKVASLSVEQLVVADDPRQTQANPEQTLVSPATQPDVAGQSPASFWRFSALLFLALWLLTAFFLYRLWRQRGHKKPQISLYSSGHSSSWNERTLKQACQANDAALVRAQLIEWANHRWPSANITGLFQLSIRIEDQRFKQDLSELDLALFSEQAEYRRGMDLYNSFKQIQRQPAKKEKPSDVALASLYPNG